MSRVLILVFLFAIASLRVVSTMAPDTSATRERFIGTGIVVDAPVSRSTVQTFSIRVDRTTPSVVQTLGVVTAQYPRYRYGDWLSVACQKIEEGACFFPTIHVIGEGRGNPLLSTLYAAKAYLVRGIQRTLPEPHASFAAALLLGERQAMPVELRDAFQATGTTHIVAVSGMHVIILSSVLSSVLILVRISALRRRMLTAAALIFFTAMIGSPASAVRGLLFGLLLLLAESVGRPRTMTMTIATATALLLIARPSFLFDLGFQLSFLAVIGIVYGAPILTNALRPFIPERPWIQSIVALAITTFSATVMTTPLLAATFGRISVVGIVANILILDLIFPATILTLLVALLAVVHTFLAFPFAILLYGALELVMRIVLVLARVPGALVAVTPPSAFTLFVLLSILCSTLFFLWGRLTPWERTHYSPR